MKKILMLILVVICTVLVGCDKKEQSLKELSKPYLGVYECVEFSFGGKDMLSMYEGYKIELTDTEIITTYKPKNAKSAVTDSCGYRLENGRIITDNDSVSIRDIRYVKGKIVVFLDIGGVPSVAKFKKK